MWKKLHSNRDPRDTLYSEIKKEFGTYFTKGGRAAARVLNSYPRFFFWSMVVSMLISTVLTFTVFRHHEAPAKPPCKVNPVDDGFNQVLAATNKIKTTIRLKHMVDSISAKKEMNKADSNLLDSALDELQRLHPTLK